MKKHVNLLTNSNITSQLGDIMKEVSRWSTIVIAILFMLLLAVGVAYTFLGKEIISSQEKLENINQFIAGNGSLDKKIKYFIFKNNVLKQYLKDDASSYTYYLWIRQFLAKIAPTAQIDKFDIDNSATAHLSLNFTQYESAMNFVQFVETPEFLDNFEYVILQDIAISKENVEQNGVKIELECKFKPIHES